MGKSSYQGLIVWQKVKVGYLTETEITEAMNLLAELGKMLTTLIKDLKPEN